MSSRLKNRTNRRNAQRSTGPKSIQGKAVSSRNATTHGLTTTRLTVLASERQEDLDALTKTITDEHKPEGDAERFFVDQMIQSRWRLARLARFETEAFDRLLDDNPDQNIDRVALDTMQQSGNIFDKLERYRGSAERTYSKALRDLGQLRANRQKEAVQNKAKEAEDWLKNRIKEIESRPIEDMTDWRWQLAGEQNEPNVAIGNQEDTAPRL